MTNLLFVLYNDIGCNSAIHVHNIAVRLVADGFDCAVAVPSRRNPRSGNGALPYKLLTHEQCCKTPMRFADGRGPDLIHAWTPREIVRKFVEALLEKESARLLIHLEDNEEAITRRSMANGSKESAGTRTVPDHLSHPQFFREFLSRANGITVLMDRLVEFVPTGTPSCIFYPGVETDLFYPRERDHIEMQRLGIPVNSTVLCYTGNVSAANALEVRSLYLAVGLLNRMGIPTTLVRTGTDYCDYLGGASSRIKPNVIECGVVDRKSVPNILSMADILIQPGRSDLFNDFRFPSKLPEFLAMGKPVIVPASNVGLILKHLEEAVVLSAVDATAIVEWVKRLRSDPDLRRRLSDGALRFASQRLRWDVSVAKVKRLYEQVLERPLGTSEAA